MIKSRNVFWRFFLIFPLLVTQQAHAKIYKCENDQSQVYYNDKPCPVADEETKMRAVKDVVNGYKPPQTIKKPHQKPKKEILNSVNLDSNSAVVKEKKVSKGSSSQELQQKRSDVNAVNISLDGSAPPMLPKEYDTGDASSQDNDEEENLPILTQEEKRQQLNISVIPDR